MPTVRADDVRAWLASSTELSAFGRGIGHVPVDGDYLESVLGMPLHLRVLIGELRDQTGRAVPSEALSSIPFYSLCRGVFLPLSGLTPPKIAQVFGLVAPEPPDTAAREALVARFFEKEIGLSLTAKLACVLGDPLEGKGTTFRRESLLQLLLSMRLMQRSATLDRLTQVGDVAVIFAEAFPEGPGSPALTAAEVLGTIRILPQLPRRRRFDVLRSILDRCGGLEAYFLCRLLLRKTGFGFDFQAELLAKLVGTRFAVDPAIVSHAAALTDLYHVVRVLESDGAAGLKKIQLQPLVPVRPALASGSTDEITRFPVWVERKYDGIRFTLHKSADSAGNVLCGAYTRNRHDWLELVVGLDATLKMLFARNVIIDGELFGTTLDIETGAKPASVYEVYATLQGGAATPVSLRFAAFDLLYLEGRDLTGLPLAQRRQILQTVVGPLTTIPTPIPFSLAEGQLAQSRDDVQRLFHHFRSQGYEGIIAKDPAGAYHLGTRDPSWLKRKPEITLDLVLMGAVLAATSKETAGRFGSYVIGAKGPDGGFVDVGDVAGVDKLRDMEIQQEILRDGLITGRRFERPSASGARPGLELRPAIVVTVRFEGVTRDGPTGQLKLRDPKLVVIRSDKAPGDCDTTRAIDELGLRQRVG